MPDQEKTKTVRFLDPFEDTEADSSASSDKPNPFEGTPAAHPAPPAAASLLGGLGAPSLQVALGPGDAPQSVFGTHVEFGSAQVEGGAYRAAQGARAGNTGDSGDPGAVMKRLGANGVNAAAPGDPGAHMRHSGANGGKTGDRGAVDGKTGAPAAPAAPGRASEPKASERATQSPPVGRTLWDAKPQRPEGGDEAWIPTEDVDDFADRGYELCLEVPRKIAGETHMEELWIVPVVNEAAERMELSWKALATLANCMIAFPGSKVTELKFAKGENRKVSES